jgi:hypothetical protein
MPGLRGEGTMRRTFIAVLVVAFVAATAVAWGSTSRVTSEPNADVALLISVGCSSDRDKDGDFNTCTNGDTASMLYSVANQTDAAQTIHIEGVFDGPGTELDRTFAQDVEIPANDLINFFPEDLRVKKSTPLGQYTLSVTASGTETASTSAFFTVQSKTGS